MEDSYEQDDAKNGIANCVVFLPITNELCNGEVKHMNCEMDPWYLESNTL